MPDPNHVPKISQAHAAMGNMNMVFVAYVEPTVFPHGLQLLLMAPGQVTPLGGGHLPAGCLVGIVTPPVPPPLLEAAQKAWRERPLAPGEVKAPGAH